MTKKSKKKTGKLRRLSPDAGRTTLALTERRLREQAHRLDRLHRRRLLLLAVIAGASATYAVVAAIALTAHHLPTAVLAVAAAVPLLAVALRATMLAWPPRSSRQLAPDITETIAHTPGARESKAEHPSEATPRPGKRHELTEPELRLSLARWNALAIDTNEADLDRLAAHTDGAARWTLVTATAVALALIALGVIRVVALALEDAPTRTFFVG